MLNTILEKVSKGIGSLSEKLRPKLHSGKVQEFWNWVDQKWYRSDLHR